MAGSKQVMYDHFPKDLIKGGVTLGISSQGEFTLIYGSNYSNPQTSIMQTPVFPCKTTILRAEQVPSDLKEFLDSKGYK
ncbi:MAG: hypothetical protein AABW47_02175 [Nanoarchaeota archaeon]